MAKSLNRIELIGNLGRDPESRETKSGETCVNLSIATSESYMNKDEERVERTEWHRVSFFRKPAEVVQRYCHKGDRLYVSGQVRTRKYQDEAGEDRYITEIVGRDFVLLSSKNESSDDAPASAKTQSKAKAKAKPAPVPAEAEADFEDDIPF